LKATLAGEMLCPSEGLIRGSSNGRATSHERVARLSFLSAVTDGSRRQDEVSTHCELAGGAFGHMNNSLVPKWCKTVIGILLLPFCIGAGVALWQVLRHSEEADTIWVATCSGAICWGIIYLLLPKPMWVYVFGHELTHALWAWLFGGKVKKFKATAKGGQVVLSKSNSLIALAPYFFPLYAFMVVLVFGLGDWIWHWRAYLVWFHLALGAAYAFHVTLTWHILKTSQSDISDQGYVFAWVTIFLGNICVLLLAIPLLAAKVDVSTAVRWWLEDTGQIWQKLWRLF
jgi:hypothetical protein